MPDLCPYAHQLCANHSACTTTPDMVQAWYKQSFRKDGENWPSKRLNWVASQVSACPQARTFPDKKEKTAKAQMPRFGLPL